MTKLLVLAAAVAFLAPAAGAQVAPPDTGKRVPPPTLPGSAVPLPALDSAAADSAAVAPIAQRQGVRVCAGGDVTLGTNLDRAWARSARKRMLERFAIVPDPDTLLAPLRPLFADADLVLLNVEGAIGEGPSPTKCARGSRNCFAFRQPTKAARALRQVAESAAVVGNVANNHSRDAGREGFDVTRRHLRRAGVLVTGADTIATAVPLPSGDTVAVLGFYTSSESPDARDLDAVRRHVARASERYGTVIVTMHLGSEGAGAQRTFDRTEIFLRRIDRGNPVKFADAAIEGGATLVIGHGPHVLRAAEWRGERLVLYSLGNLLTYGPFGLAEPMNRGVVACATIDSAGVVSAGELRSTVQIAPGVLLADSSQRAARLIDSLSALDFPRTGALVDSTGQIGRRDALQQVGAERSPGNPAPDSLPKPTAGERRPTARPTPRSPSRPR